MVKRTYGFAACSLTDVNVALHYICYVHSTVSRDDGAEAADLDYCCEAHASLVSTCAFLSPRW